jgi:hypothetical protein
MSSQHGSLLPPKPIRLPLDLVAVTGEHKKIIGKAIQVRYYTSKLQRVLILSGASQQTNHMSLSSATNCSDNMGPSSRDMSTRKDEVF